MLGHGIVHRDDRETQRAGFLHGPQADDTRRRLLGSADHVGNLVGPFFVQRRDQVGPVVHGDIREVVEGGVDVPVVGRVVLALDGKSRDPMVGYQTGSDIVLSGQGI